MAKIGQEHAAAMARQGLHELRNALYTQSNVAAQAEYGIVGTTTPGEVAEARDSDPKHDQEPRSEGEILASRVEHAQSQPSRDSKSLVHDRG